MGSKACFNLGKGHSNLGQASAQGGSFKGKKGDDFNTVKVFTYEFLGKIQPRHYPNDGVEENIK